MPLNPDLAAYLQLVDSGRRSGKALPMHQLQPEEARRQFDQSSALMDPGADEPAFIESRTFTARDGYRVEARLYRPPERDESLPSGAALYLHGGGYVVGSLDSHDALCWNLAQECGLPVLSVGYRLAPQWRFPTALNDAQDAWQWLALNARELGIDAERMAVVGDSVGGSLATVLASSLAVQEELPRPCLQVLIYPVTDASRVSASVERYGVGHLLEKDTLEWFYQQYQNDPADRLDPRFSPLLGEVTARVAPALLIVAECDPLHDEAVAYARHLEVGGVPVQLEVFEGMSHDFLRMGSIVDEADLARERIVLALAEHLG